MKNNKIYSLISLCARARRLCSGNFSVEKAVKNQSAYVVIVAKDASDNTKKLFDQKEHPLRYLTRDSGIRS